MGNWMRGLSIVIGSLLLWSANSAAEEVISDKALVGTIWATQSPYTWTKIDRHGRVQTYPSEGNYLQFLGLNGGVFSIKIHWWNGGKNLNVVEHGILIRFSENSFHYIEAEHPDHPDFPGMSGHGFLRIVDQNNAELSQVGHLSDGAAAGFSIRYKRVKEVPKPPIPVTYPSQN